MTTNKIALRTNEEFMGGYNSIYQPIYPLFMGPRAQQYAREVGEVQLRRVTTIGDIRAKRVTPKDTEIKQINVSEGKKPYKKYFFRNQFVLSVFQDSQGVDDVTSQVLDEHQCQYDEIFFTGDGQNNGLYTSSDVNYILENSTAIASSERLYDFHAKVMVTAEKANRLAGKKLIIFYGATILPLVNSLFPTSAAAFRAQLQASLGSDYAIATMPEASTPNGAAGWMIANLDQTKLHYTVIPELQARGQNEEKGYIWSNFLMGSTMLEVLGLGGVIRQPATLA